MIYLPVNSMKPNPNQSSMQQQTSELKRPNPPTTQAIERAQFKDQDVQMEWEVSLIFDIETNGLLHDVSTIHCLAIHDLQTDQTIAYNDTGSSEPISRGLQRLQDSDRVIGHNIIGYDLPVIRKLYPWFGNPAHVVDTLLLSRLYHPDMINLDKKRTWDGMPLKLYGKHSLESYGYRLDERKGDYGSTSDWADWSQEMEDYCIQDVHVTTKLWKHFQPYLNGSR